MAPGGLVDSGLKWLFEKLEKGIEGVMKMDTESKGLEISAGKILSELGAMKGAYDATRKVFNMGESDPKLLKYYEEISGELKKVEVHMKDRLEGVQNLVKFLVFQDKIKIPAIRISEALYYYYSHRSGENKRDFVEKVRRQGPPMSILRRLRDQLPKILLGYKERSSDNEKEKLDRLKNYIQCAQMVLLVVIQMVTANEEYLNVRFPDDKHKVRNDAYRNELMEIVRDIYGILNFKIEYPKFDSEKVGALVKNIASSSNEGHHEILIHEALKKEFKDDYFLVVSYHGNTFQAEKTDDGNTVTFSKDGNNYVVHRFNVLLPDNSLSVLESRAKCDDLFSYQIYTGHRDYTEVPKLVTKQTKSFALYYELWNSKNDFKINYKIDDEVKAALFFKDQAIEGVDANDTTKLQRAALIATLA